MWTPTISLYGKAFIYIFLSLCIHPSRLLTVMSSFVSKVQHHNIWWNRWVLEKGLSPFIAVLYYLCTRLCLCIHYPLTAMELPTQFTHIINKLLNLSKCFIIFYSIASSRCQMTMIKTNTDSLYTVPPVQRSFRVVS